MASITTCMATCMIADKLVNNAFCIVFPKFHILFKFLFCSYLIIFFLYVRKTIEQSLSLHHSASNPFHSPHLPLFYLEISRSCWTPMQSLQRKLILLLILFIMIRKTNFCRTFITWISLVADIEIISISNNWPTILTTINYILRFL